jgi:hypothetical protein
MIFLGADDRHEYKKAEYAYNEQNQIFSGTPVLPE